MNNEENRKRNDFLYDMTVSHIWFGILTYQNFAQKSGTSDFIYGPPLEKLISLSKNFGSPLNISSISYASPGWIDLIGNWNPLKIIADSFRHWREQNTMRQKHKLDAEVKKEKIILDAENERSEFRVIC